MRLKHKKKSKKHSYLYTNEFNRQEHTHRWFNTVLPYQRIVYGIFSVSSAESDSGGRLYMQTLILFRYLEQCLEGAVAAGTHDFYIDSRVAMEKAKRFPLVTDNHLYISTEEYRILANTAVRIEKIFTLCLALNEKVMHIRGSEILRSIVQKEAGFIFEVMSILDKKEPSSMSILGCRSSLLNFDNEIEKISDFQVNPGEIYAHGKILTLLTELKRGNKDLLVSLSKFPTMRRK
ncbi:MAG: hypothetical protein K9M94_14460 [Spirochaetia bacterium]|nr:hypothetical protein [Spirochaetia bacterium]